MRISVSALGQSKYRVTVTEDGSSTTHDVSVTGDDVSKYSPGSSPERLLERSFEFLLEREPKESIMRSFALPVIERYFPEYARIIRTKNDG